MKIRRIIFFPYIKFLVCALFTLSLQNNRWRKRGIAIMPMCFNLGYPDFRFGVLVNIYSHDGTVSIAHGGIEMGQGLNTKAGVLTEWVYISVFIF